MRLTQHRAALPTLPPTSRDQRRPGLHLSAIIKDLASTLEPDRFGKGKGSTAEDARLDLDEIPRIWLGQAFDTYLGQVLDPFADASFRPGGVRVDGIWMTSDLVRVAMAVDGSPEIEEWKLTWMSLRQGIEDPKFRHWFWQLLGYFHAWGATAGWLRVFAVNGDYGPPTPQYRVWRVEATEREIEDNWSMIVRHAKWRGIL